MHNSPAKSKSVNRKWENQTHFGAYALIQDITTNLQITLFRAIDEKSALGF